MPIFSEALRRCLPLCLYNKQIPCQNCFLFKITHREKTVRKRVASVGTCIETVFGGRE